MVLPIVAMVLTINVVFAVSWYLERLSQEDDLESHVITVLNSHATYLSREIFFDRSAAVAGRLSEIVNTSEWNPDGLSARLCLHLVFNPKFNSRQPESVCSDGSAAIYTPETMPSIPSVTLRVGDNDAANLHYDLTLKNNLSMSPTLFWSMGLGVLAAVLAYLALFRRLNSNIIQPAHRRIVRAEKLAGIAQFVQTFAHDIRSPLSLIRTIIRNLEEPEIKSQTKTELLALVDKELGQINNMLADVMSIGPIKPKSDPLSPVAVIANALNHAVALRGRSGITFEYDLKHAKQIAVEGSKVARVFANVIDNAMHAVNDRGSLWVKTHEQESGRSIEFCIGNTGSYIAVEDREKVFDAFFTKGKSGGTGLGLASAKAIVEAHGGEIWCDSDANKGTSFFFSFPAHELADQQSSILLPKSSDEVLTSRTSLLASTPVAITVPPRLLNILLVDDEAAYLQALAGIVESFNLNDRLKISSASSVVEALKIAERTSLDLVISDMDFGYNQPDGFHLLRELKARFANTRVAICTNRTGDTFRAKVLDAGAIAYITKPANDAALISLFNDVIARIAERTPTRPQVIFVDDQLIFFKDWSRRFKDVEFHYFSSPDQLWSRLKSESAFLDRIDAVLTDFKFGSEEDGADVARRIRAICAKPVYLISNYTEDELGDRLDRTLFTGIISKDDTSNEGELRRKLNWQERS